MDEVNMAGATGSNNSSYYLYTNQYYWLGSPRSFDDVNTYGFAVRSTGVLSSVYVHPSYGARPAVSLKPGATWSGEGTSSNPYTVSWN